MGKDALVCVLADRPYGSIKTFVADNLALAVSLVGGDGGQWYLVQFQVHENPGAARAALAHHADIRRWVQLENPAWRDRLSDLLQLAPWPRTGDSTSVTGVYKAQSSSGDRRISSMVPVGPPLSKR